MFFKKHLIHVLFILFLFLNFLILLCHIILNLTAKRKKGVLLLPMIKSKCLCLKMVDQTLLYKSHL